jgi:cell division septation protein DedD
MAGGDRDSRFRFELTRLELVGVIVSTAASLSIVFLLGVWAGHGVGGRRLADDERIVRVPVAPAAAEETPGAESDLTFDDTLGDDPLARLAAGAGGEQQPAGADGAHAGEGARVAVTERPAEPAPAAEHAAEPPRAPAPARTPEARVAVALAEPPAPRGAPAAALPPSDEGGAWSVQVTATRAPRTAEEMVKRLRAKGYQAYIVKARRQGAIFYRVRVGHFASMEHASLMVSRLRREPGVPEAFVASD